MKPHALRHLDEADPPESAAGFAEWFALMDDRDFDEYGSQVVMDWILIRALEDELTGREVVTVIASLRDRYRKVNRVTQHRAKGKENGRAKLNEKQVRILRQLPKNVSSRSMSDIWGISKNAIESARAHRTWRHIA